MARIPIRDSDTAQTPEARRLFAGLQELGLEKFANQLGVLANHPPLAGAIFGLLQAYYFHSVVPRKYLEMAILLVSVRNRCNYCVVHHAPPALDAGLSRAQLEAIEQERWEDSGLFDAVEQAVLRYTDQLNARGGRVDESLFEQLRTHFDAQQLVELTLRAAMCEFFNRFNEAFQIDMEGVAAMLYRSALEDRTEQPAPPGAGATS